MSRNTRENPHRKLYTPDQVAALERYHRIRRSTPLGGAAAPRRRRGGDVDVAARLAMQMIAGGRRRG